MASEETLKIIPIKGRVTTNTPPALFCGHPDNPWVFKSEQATQSQQLPFLAQLTARGQAIYKEN